MKCMKKVLNFKHCTHCVEIAVLYYILVGLCIKFESSDTYYWKLGPKNGCLLVVLVAKAEKLNFRKDICILYVIIHVLFT